MSYTKKPLSELNVMDDFMMNALTSDPEIGVSFCRMMLGVLLQRRIGTIQVIAQKVIPAATPDKRGIRMDVVIEETLDRREKENMAALRIYDIEPHIPNNINLPKHNRFYQAKIDGMHLKSGSRDFGSLPELYVITLTDYDPFGYDYMMYTVESRCIEVPHLEYRDDLHYIYFYTDGTKGGSAEIKEMLRYLGDSRQENAAGESTRKIHELVQKVKAKPETEMEYMKFDDLIEYTREEGREEGEAFGTIRILKKYNEPDSKILEELVSGLKMTEKRAKELLDEYQQENMLQN